MFSSQLQIPQNHLLFTLECLIFLTVLYVSYFDSNKCFKPFIIFKSLTMLPEWESVIENGRLHYTRREAWMTACHITSVLCLNIDAVFNEDVWWRLHNFWFGLICLSSHGDYGWMDLYEVLYRHLWSHRDRPCFLVFVTRLFTNLKNVITLPKVKFLMKWKKHRGRYER